MNSSVTKINLRGSNMLPQGHQISNIFGPLVPDHEGVSCVAKLSIHNVKKMVCPKNVQMGHCSLNDWEVGINDFLKRVDQRKEGDCLKRGDKFPLPTMNLRVISNFNYHLL